MADVTPETALASDQPQTVNVLNPYGQPENIPQSNLNEALGVGYKVASPDQVNEWKAQKQFGTGVVNPLEAAAAGFGRGATFGLSDQVLTKSGAVRPETLAGLKKYNPVSSTVGEIGGIGASLAAAPEISPVGAVSKVGQGITEALAPAISESTPLIGKILGQAGAGAVGSSVEGAAYGLGQSVTEQALGDPDLNAQKLLSNVGYGALWGGALGGLLKGGEAGAPAALEAAKDSLNKVGETIFGPPGEVGRLGQLYSHASSFVSGRPAEEIIQALNDRKLSLTTPEQTHDLAADLSKSLNEHVENLAKITKDANGVMRPDETSKLLENIPNAVPFQKYTDIINEMQKAASAMKAEPVLHDPYYAKILDDLTSHYGSKIFSDSSSNEIFNSMNELKKQLDGEIPYGKNNSMMPPAQRRAINIVRDVRSTLKDTLQDEAVFGEAGARQAAWNDAQNQHLTLTGNKGLFKKYFLEPQVTRTGQQVFKVSPTKVKSFLGQLGNLTGDEKARVLQEFLDSSDNLINEADKTYNTFGTEPINKKATSDIVDKTKGLRDKAIEQTEFNKRLNRLGAGAHNTYLGEAGALFAGVHHPALGAGIEAFNMLRNPGLTVQRLAKIEKSVQATTNAISKASKAVFKITNQSADALTGYAAGKLATGSDTEKHDKTIAQINDLANNPQKMVDSLDRATKDLYHIAPQISQNLQTTAVRATQFLSSKIPRDNDQVRGPLSPPYTPSQSEIAEFQKNLSLIKDPVSIFKEIQAATITQDSIDAIKTVYPKLFDHMQIQLLNEMTNMVAKNKAHEIPYRVKMAASLFLNQDLDGTMNPQEIAASQLSLSQPGMQQAKNEMSNQIKVSQKGLSKLGQAQSMMTAQQKSSQRETAS